MLILSANVTAMAYLVSLFVPLIRWWMQFLKFFAQCKEGHFYVVQVFHCKQRSLLKWLHVDIDYGFWIKPLSSTKPPHHHSSILQETHTRTETTILKVVVSVGSMEQKGTWKTFPPLLHLFPLMQSFFPLSGGKQHGQSSLLSIPPSLSTLCSKETQSKRHRTRLWAWVYDCLYEHVCAQMFEFERVCVPVRVFENVCASLPLTFCCLGGHENLTRPSKVDYYSIILSQI